MHCFIALIIFLNCIFIKCGSKCERLKRKIMKKREETDMGWACNDHMKARRSTTTRQECLL